MQRYRNGCVGTIIRFSLKSGHAANSGPTGTPGDRLRRHYFIAVEGAYALHR
jgi:hypothetical protein